MPKKRICTASGPAALQHMESLQNCLLHWRTDNVFTLEATCVHHGTLVMTNGILVIYRMTNDNNDGTQKQQAYTQQHYTIYL